jgi:hypothetical protein
MIVSAIVSSSLQPHAAAFALAGSPLDDQLDAGGVERFDQFHERVDVTADHPVARFHPLNGGERETSHLGQLALVNSEESPRSAQLRSCDDGIGPSLEAVFLF